MQAILERHDAQANRAVLGVGIARLVDCVVVDVNHVVEHTHGNADGALQLRHIQFAVLEMRAQIDRAEIADRDLFAVGVERDLGTQVGGVHHAHVLLR